MSAFRSRTNLPAAEAVLAASLFLPAAASAITAADVRCSGRVDGTDVRKDAIKSGKILNGQVRPP